MDKNEQGIQVNLLYPLSMYYVGAIEGVPTLEEQYQILAESREYSEKTKTRIDPYSIDEPVIALNLMMEKLEQYEYFEGVRNIVNNLLSQNRKPQELFRSLFPNSEEKINIFKSQFSDACDLICMKDKVDWKRMGLSWYNFDIAINNKKQPSLKMDWSPDYWTLEEKNQLFNFWRERYSRVIINMSPSGKPAGGIGFFDAERHSLRFKTYRPTYNENHQVNLDFKRRREDLLKEQEISQPADKLRLELLLNVEYQAWEWWKIKNVYKIKEHDPLYFINKTKEKIFYHESLYKEAFAQLIEYDRMHNFAVADPNRDFKKDPMTIVEYRQWLEREGREIPPKSDDDILLENVWNEGPLGNITGKVPPSMKNDFIPSFIDEYHRNQQRSDRKKGIERSKSGVIIKINGEIKEKISIERPDIIKNLKKSNNLQDDIVSFKSNIDDGRPEVEEIELDLIPMDVNKEKTTISLKKSEEINIENVEDQEVKDPIIPELFDISTLPSIPKNPYGDDLFKGLFTEKEFSEEEVVIDSDSEEEEEGTNGEGHIPPWMKNRNVDGIEADINQVEESPDKFRDKVKKARKRANKTFDRNKEIQEITKSWKGLDEFDSSSLEGDIWSITQERIKNFKDSAKNIWEGRLSYLLNVDIPEQKALLKIKTQELIAFKNRIMEKRVFNKKNIEEIDNDVEEVVKPVSLHVTSYKPRKNK